MGYNEVTKGIAKVGGLAFGDNSVGLRVQRGTIARTNTADTTLFTLPANAVVILWAITGATDSNAGTTAVIDVGPSGSDTSYIDAFDVKGSGNGTFTPSGQVAGSIGSSAVQVVGKYAETGTASTAGGPWTVTALYTA